MGQRRKAREVALQVLYQIDVLKIDVEEATQLFWNNFEAPEEVREFSSMLIKGAWNHREEIDRFISGCSEYIYCLCLFCHEIKHQ